MTGAPDITGEKIVIRPLTEDDIEAAWTVAQASLARMSEAFGPSGLPPSSSAPSPERRVQGYARVKHLYMHDPGGAWVAVAPGAGIGGRDEVVGTGLACRRGGLWFLSLLAVDTSRQAIGVGRRLLDATLAYGAGASSAWILSSSDPKALRRYQSAGFDLHPGYAAVGEVDRTAIPARLGVRPGDWDRDGELVDEIVTSLRGAPYGPDLELFQALERALVIIDGLGYAILKPSGVVSLGARSREAATRLLWAALAAANETINLEWLFAGQQWAIDVAVRGRLGLYAGPSSCLRDVAAPMTPFIPSGALG
jgi:GNAT superfamily N-acetyltransferase